ncbi:MAG TPA: zinc-ribbon domain-containing protein [Methanocella sp.]|nr:zinc-ribbon domain-containing protein [Methanocella sp.]
MVLCSNCGAEVPSDAQFCPKCGSPTAPLPGSDWREKRREYRAFRRSYRWNLQWSPEWGLINAVFVGLLVIYAGSIMYLASAGLSSLITWSNFWAWLLIGLGGLMFLRSVARFVIGGRRHWYGDIIGGLILMIIGAAALASWTRYIWVIMIVAGGVIIILAGLVNYLLIKR